MKPWTDEQLQAYLDGDAPLPPEAEGTSDLAAYRLLYEGLATAPDEALAPGFSERIARRVHPSKASYPWLEEVVLPALLCIIFAVGVALSIDQYDLDLQPLAVVGTWLHILPQILPLHMILGTGLILALLGLFDRLVLQSRLPQAR